MTNLLGGGPGTGMIDWDLAVTTALRLLRPGPEVSRKEAFAAVAQLRELSVAAERHVATVTHLEPAASTEPVAVVDRPRWVRENVNGFQTLLDPLIDRLQARSKQEPSPLVAAVGARLAGVQIGTLLAFLSAKVLGQYELFGTGGRLLLVAPNIVHVEQELRVEPRDFRLWVCLHEVTHRVQFSAVPWLGGYLRSEIDRFVDATDLDPASMLQRLRDTATALIGTARGDEGVSLLDAVQTPEQREVLDRLTAVMSLLEGHADYVMDGVGEEVVPTVRTIRDRFDRRRAGAGPLDQLLRRLLGLDVKMKQYAEGAAFVRGVVDRVGMDGFNHVWTSPDTLPTRAEINDPAGWVARVHPTALEA